MPLEDGPILEVLNDLREKYDVLGTSGRDSTYYSKLAVLECCGWIEWAFDEIVDSTRGNLTTDEFKNILTGLIKRNYGFQYNDNLRRMLIQALGLAAVERIEDALQPDLVILKSELASLNTARKYAAHTWIQIMPTYDSPLITIDRFNQIYPIVKKIESRVTAEL